MAQKSTSQPQTCNRIDGGQILRRNAAQIGGSGDFCGHFVVVARVAAILMRRGGGAGVAVVLGGQHHVVLLSAGRATAALEPTRGDCSLLVKRKRNAAPRRPDGFLL